MTLKNIKMKVESLSTFQLHSLVFLIALFTRFAAYVAMPNLLSPDSYDYAKIGNELLLTGVVSNTKAMPFLPVLLGLMSFAQFKVLQLLLSALTCNIIFAWGSHQHSKLYALAPALFAALYLNFIYFALIPLTETLFLFLMALAFLLLEKKLVLLASFTLLLSILTRPSLELICPFFVFAYALIQSHDVKHALKNLAIYFTVYLVMMTPWWIHNYRRYGTFVRLNLGLGSVLYIGNVNILEEGLFLPATGENVSTPTPESLTTDLERNQYLVNKAVETMKESPARTIKYFAIKAVRLFKPFPDPSQNLSFLKMILVTLGTLLLYTYFIFRIIRFRDISKKGYIFILMALYLAAIHIITLPNIRYRLPIDLLMLFIISSVKEKGAKNENSSHNSML